MAGDWHNGMRWIGEATKKDEKRVYYKAAELEPDDGDEENFLVHVGDDIELFSREAPGDFFLARIEQLFGDDEGAMRMSVRWYFRPLDTWLSDESSEFDDEKGLKGKRVWLAEDNSSFHSEMDLSCVNRVVNVKHVSPGDPIPLDEEFDYWYNQVHTEKFHTFRDIYPEGRSIMKRTTDSVREFAAMDLFSGCGGMSFVAQSNDKVSIVTKHAVDNDADALLSYKVNHPTAHTHFMGVDQFLFLCKHMDRVYAKWLDAAGDSCASTQSHLSGDASTSTVGEKNQKKSSWKRHFLDIVEILDVDVNTTVEILKTGQSVGQLDRPLNMKNTWLEFPCRTRDGLKRTVRLAHLEERHPDLLKNFVAGIRDKIPRPGDIDLIVGGPPCQGISGFNRHASSDCILENCRRNALVKAMFRVVEFFKPAYSLMENVLDTVKKSNGEYAKYAIRELLSIGYQTRAGIIAAGDHGAPQVRCRIFVWGARSGQEILPPFPQPTFRLGGSATTPVNIQQCRVDFLSEDARNKAFPGTLIGDVVGDLPEVSNFCVSEHNQYRCDPKKPFHALMRREPPPNTPSKEERAKKADEFMKDSIEDLCKKILGKWKQGTTWEESMLKVGELSVCSSRCGFAYESWCTADASNPDYRPSGDRMNHRILEANRKRMILVHGAEILREMKRARTAEGVLRDHIPRICNSDDYIRVESIPFVEGAGFRQLKGVVVNEDETTCAGHSHAFRGKGCTGGGVAKEIKPSIFKEGRVDFAEKDGWRGVTLEKCDSYAVFLPSHGLLCPRWCVTFRQGKMLTGQNCFGRIKLNRPQTTVVTRAEPHNIAICHPEQNRTLTIRENARIQGFPDFFAFVGTGVKMTLSRRPSVQSRFRQVGNAVCPQVAMALGRGLLQAAAGEACPESPVVDLPDLELNKLYESFDISNNAAEGNGNGVNGNEGGNGMDADVNGHHSHHSSLSSEEKASGEVLSIYADECN